jgi:predicted TIM-barrel fold metal-dependent hydrolase
VKSASPALRTLMADSAGSRAGGSRVDSAPYRNGAAGEDFAKTAYPLLRNAYGLDRLLWGSDWPHTQFEKAQSYAKNLRFIDGLIVDQSERAQVLASPRSLCRF